MINTILFDLDGTLLQLKQDTFIKVYLAELAKVFSGMGLDADASIKAVWAGTRAMVENDGSQINALRFWEVFSGLLGLDQVQQDEVEAACDYFYTHQFEAVRAIATPTDVPRRLIKALQVKGYTLVLATSPLFPACAMNTRLAWIGLAQDDFLLVTHYKNCRYCKPNLNYYAEVLAQIERGPEQCLMVGNNTNEDMCIEAMGVKAFLVTDCLENQRNLDIASFKNGTLKELEAYLMAFPDIL